jgi:RimJ/RimL family protein N-acetyltransferase
MDLNFSKTARECKNRRFYQFAGARGILPFGLRAPAFFSRAQKAGDVEIVRRVVIMFFSKTGGLLKADLIYNLRMIKALRFDSIELVLIDEENAAAARSMFEGFPDSDYMLSEINESYLPEFDESQRRTKYGFYSLLNGELAGLSLLGIDCWKTSRGYTGADTLIHMRGRGVAPRSKPHLFYLAFELLGLNRLETGCFVSNAASKKSIEKTAGFQFEGIRRESGVNDDGEFEDELFYGILRRDWLGLYDKTQIEVVY